MLSMHEISSNMSLHMSGQINMHPFMRKREFCLPTTSFINWIESSFEANDIKKEEEKHKKTPWVENWGSGWCFKIFMCVYVVNCYLFKKLFWNLISHVISRCHLKFDTHIVLVFFWQKFFLFFSLIFMLRRKIQTQKFIQIQAWCIMVRGWKLLALLATIIVYIIGILVLSIVNLQAQPHKRMRNSRFLTDVRKFGSF